MAISGSKKQYGNLLQTMGLCLAVWCFSLSSLPTAQAGEKSALLTEVHFDPGSANVTPGGQQKIKAAIAAIKKQGPKEIHVIGFTDRTGDEKLNQTIARQRANNVASLLAEQGITAPLIVEGKGEHGAPYKTPDNVSEPLNRCVGIIAVSSSSTKPPL